MSAESPADRAQRPKRCSAAIRPAVKTTETYTETNFLRVHTTLDPRVLGMEASAQPALRVVTIEHLSYRPSSSGDGGWRCQTIVDREAMTGDDALFIAQRFAEQNDIPVIYRCGD